MGTASAPTAPATEAELLRGQVLQITPEGSKANCRMSNGSTVVVSSFLGAHIRPGDEIEFPLTFSATSPGSEVYIRKTSARRRDVYQAPIGYAAQPKTDTRDKLYVRAQVSQGRLGISAIHLPCEVLRDHFYVAKRRQPWDQQPTLYDVLRLPPTASQAELRLGFKLRELELRAAGAPQSDLTAVERAFNIVGQPELRACYEALVSDASAPVLFPYGGFGSLIVLGDRSRDGQMFFAHQIVSFLPDRRPRRFRAPLRKLDFYNDHAVYRDARRKLDVLLDQAALPLVWDATWNRWKHLLPTKVEIQGTFVQAGKYRHHRGEWKLIQWETALPSRLAVKLPENIAEQLETARKTYDRFGQFSDALDRIRARIEREPVEREELKRLCWDLRIPGDFDIAQITWRPDYDEFFYRQLCRRTRRLYLFRGEYILELEAAIAVETPQLGHATYLFSKPRSMEEFLAVYIRATKEDIRRNRGNVAEKLGFLGRVVHGVNPRAWLRELTSKIGEHVDCADGGDEAEETTK